MDLNRILQSEIFFHRDEQLRAVHVTLGFKPISKHFQSAKHVIKAKNPRLAIIDVALPRFLTEPLPLGTQDAGLPAQLAAKLPYSYEQTIPSDEE